MSMRKRLWVGWMFTWKYMSFTLRAVNHKPFSRDGIIDTNMTTQNFSLWIKQLRWQRSRLVSSCPPFWVLGSTFSKNSFFGTEQVLTLLLLTIRGILLLVLESPHENGTWRSPRLWRGQGGKLKLHSQNGYLVPPCLLLHFRCGKIGLRNPPQRVCGNQQVVASLLCSTQPPKHII